MEREFRAQQQKRDDQEAGLKLTLHHDRHCDARYLKQVSLVKQVSVVTPE